MNIAVDEQALLVHQQTQAARRRRLRLLAGVGLASLALLAWGSWWWLAGRFAQSTDDAYVRADWVAISARVPGYVEQVLVGDDQPVKAGQAPLRLQDRDYQARLEQARAALQQAVAALVAAEAEQAVTGAGVRHQALVIEQVRVAVEAAQAEHRRSALDLQRYQALMHDHAATQQRLDSARADEAGTRAARQVASARLAGEQQQMQVAQARVVQADAHREQALAARAEALANLKLAEHNLDDTLVRAPIDGVVGQRRVRAGQYLVAGQPLLAVVPVSQAYVVANFKETQLQHLRAGQPVELAVDSYPGQTLRGHVGSVSPGSGSVFALLPADNATGNFTKVVQRFPVRIELDEPQGMAVLPGMSVIATVDTHGAGAAP